MKYEIKKYDENNAFAMLPVVINRQELSGSEKQVEWANDLINVVISKLAENNNCHGLRLPKGINIDDPRIEIALDKHAENIRAKYSLFFGYIDAKYYIEKLKGITGNTSIDIIQAIITK